MKEEKHLFTSESVSEGHPDKLCDQISDAILDAALIQDPLSRVACESMVTFGKLFVAGELTTKAKIDYEKVARHVIKEVGYDSDEMGFNYKTCEVQTHIQSQSPDIAMGVDKGGAGDQGMMFGFACDETKELMPLPIALAHKLVRELTKIRKQGELDYLRPDSKSQVTIEYQNDKPVHIDAIVISTQHNKNVALEKIEKDVKNILIKRVIPANLFDAKTKIFVNPTGRFEIGGPQGDTGLTGRKIIVDTYGGYGAHGGGAFSGKDPSKVDRSAAYFARYLAKNVVASGAARQCEIQIAYAIGVAEPVSVLIDTFGTGQYADNQIVQVLRQLFDFTPNGIISQLDLRRPIYQKTAAYGHFGREEEGFTWEKTNAAQKIRQALENSGAASSESKKSK
ncbi:MAG: methionine adenosyltransferase [Candidatus Omnitrophica bacterium CG11_big_fil_rev_8_21_14_0_20_45_26]|uniref:S-adenosylmethionine synthase n=1 Tax=Candidatus Abzuiibacterium crystallinum TaxID=1974748 RepID=A0A2H0LMP2_9BACT|nr:MAG: methionine adenosyltransferase [Candidatus Omnitrophica bacterium CG11_big_fil_rev_8_21_14_0_20_45_26]PIW65216.1 MAG: methionine adenosyltransferase [Candidatus Omnitrophica bacterium CG12_big_fil_rev_8_21_14_0_65_45_16]